MADLFSIDLKDLINLRKFFKRAPKKMRSVSAGVLNDLAFGTMSESRKILQDNLTIRNPRFFKSRLRVEKAKKNQSLRSQIAIVGSVAADRFSGWAEQELGTRAARTRSHSLFARGGDKEKQIRPSFRLKPSSQFRDPDNAPGKTPHHRAVIMIKTLARQRYKKPFIIKGHKRIKSGVFKFNRGRRLERLQTFKPRRSSLQPKRLLWLRGGNKTFMRSTSLNKIWQDQIDHELLKGQRRKLK